MAPTNIPATAKNVCPDFRTQPYAVMLNFGFALFFLLSVRRGLQVIQHVSLQVLETSMYLQVQ